MCTKSIQRTTVLEAPRLDALDHAVHVWLIDLREDDDVTLSGLQPGEQQRALRFYQEIHRHRFTVSHRWQMRLLSHYLDVSVDDVVFRVGHNGKPSLLVAGKRVTLQFNLSHSKDFALLALTNDRELGVDIEFCRDSVRALDIADRFFTPFESSWLHEHEDAEVVDAFFTLWVRKESIIKALGTGLSQGLNTFECGAGQHASVHYVARPGENTAAAFLCRSLDAPENYRAALTERGVNAVNEGKPVRQYLLNINGSR